MASGLVPLTISTATIAGRVGTHIQIKLEFQGRVQMCWRIILPALSARKLMGDLGSAIKELSLPPAEELPEHAPDGEVRIWPHFQAEASSHLKREAT